MLSQPINDFITIHWIFFQVCKGDKVIVWVENKMEDGSSTSVHWHGQTQMNSCHMDGTGMLTQCAIPPYEVFR